MKLKKIVQEKAKRGIKQELTLAEEKEKRAFKSLGYASWKEIEE